MGMGHGGARPGAGRKPKVRPPGVVLGMDGRRLEIEPLRDQPPPPAGNPQLEIPPSELTREQRAFWRAAAPLAIDQGTLVPTTVIGFRELCKEYGHLEVLDRKIEKLGAASRNGEALLKTRQKVAQRFDATLARFKLTAFGKPADPAASRRSAAAANPWAEVAR